MLHVGGNSLSPQETASELKPMPCTSYLFLYLRHPSVPPQAWGQTSSTARPAKRSQPEAS